MSSDELAEKKDNSIDSASREGKHDGLSALEVLREVQACLPAASHLSVEDGVRVRFVLYDAFAIRGELDDYGSGKSWGFSLMLDPETRIASLLGVRLTLRDSREAIRDTLAAIDRYARLRLGEDYLAAYDEGMQAQKNNL